MSWVDILFDSISLLFDIGIKVALWMIYIILENSLPSMRHIEEEEIWYYRYPSVRTHLPRIYLWLTIIIFPSIVYFVEYMIKRNRRDIVHSVAGFTLAVPMNAVLTSFLKVYIGRPRPNFFARCFPDGYGHNFESCTGDYKKFMDARKSFPSSHASFSFTAFLYITLHLLKVTDIQTSCRGKSWKFCLCVFPLFVACYMSMSRIMDYHHHFSDVIGGALIGCTIASSVFWAYVDDPTGIKRQSRYYGSSMF